MSANYDLQGDVAVITLNNPPVNGLGYDTRRAVADGVERANADASVRAIVITGAGKAFSGGAAHQGVRLAQGDSRAQPAEPDPRAGGQRQARRGGRCTACAWVAVWSSRWAATYRVASPGANVALP